MSKPTEQKQQKQKKSAEFPGANGNGESNDTYQLSDDDGATVRSAEMSIMEQHRQLGVIREQYFVAEAQAAQKIGEARKKYQAVLQTMAEKHGIDLTKNSWAFNQQTMTFSKQPPVQ